MSYSRKNPSRAERFEDKEFPGVIKKQHVEFPWVLVYGLEISKGCKGASTKNFHHA